LIGFREGAGTGEPLYATDPTSGKHLQPGFIPASNEELDLAVRLAADAFDDYRRAPAVATGAPSCAGLLTRLTGSPKRSLNARLRKRPFRGLVCKAKLTHLRSARLFAQVAEEGSWVKARIDQPILTASPFLRLTYSSILRPLGSVVVSAPAADLGDGYTRRDWFVHYPINNYDVSVNIGNYQHFSDRLGNFPLDFYALPEDLNKAKKQFVQAKGMLEAFQHYFGEYPFQNRHLSNFVNSFFMSPN
jgi:hypothetical protein